MHSYYDVVSSPSLIAPAKWKTYGPCANVEGVCQDIKHPCALSYLSFQCPGVSVSNVRCCPTKQLVDIGLDGEKWRLIPGPPAATCNKNLMFPLAPGSLQFVSVNFGGKRNGGSQCHAGIDLFAHNAKKVVAMTDGIVTNVINNFITCKCTGKPMQAGAVLIYHPSIGQTINYAEMGTSSIAVKKGATVARGQVLGTADACCLLHIELYNGSHAQPLHWLPNKMNGKTSYDPDGCTHNSMDVKPAALLDPRPMINCVKPAGASLLQDAGVGGEQVAGVNSPSGKHISAGVIAAIVIVGVLVLVAIGVCVGCLLRRQQIARSAAGGELSVKNELYSADAVTSNTAPQPASSALPTPPARSPTMTAPTSFNSGGTIGYNSGGTMPYSSGGTMSYDGGTMMSSMSEGTMLRRPQPTPGGTFIGGTNRATEAVGQFPCTICGKEYQYATDLEQHRLLRHP